VKNKTKIWENNKIQ